MEGLYSMLMRLVLPMLLLVRGTSWAGAEGDGAKAALMNGSRSGGDDAGEVLFAVQESRGSQLNFLTHLLKRTPEPGAEKVELCGNAFDPNKMLNQPDKWTRLAGLDDAKKVAALGPDDPLLLLAYAELFMTSFDGDSKVPAWYVVAKNDLRQRGDAATPRLLRLFDVHPSQQFREGLLFQIDSFPTIRIEPYLAAARNCWWTLGMETPERTCLAISRLLSRHGTAEDLKILEEMKQGRQAGVGGIIQGDTERMARRLKAAREE